MNIRHLNKNFEPLELWYIKQILLYAAKLGILKIPHLKFVGYNINYSKWQDSIACNKKVIVEYG